MADGWIHEPDIPRLLSQIICLNHEWRLCRVKQKNLFVIKNGMWVAILIVTTHNKGA